MNHPVGRVLIVGAMGQVGRAVREAFLAQGLPEGRIVGAGRAVDTDCPLVADVSNLSDPYGLMETAQPDVVVNAAGMTWVDGCEADPDKAFRSNATGPEALAKAARAVGARNLYFSTEYVFDGNGGPYREDSPTAPLSVYGRSKLAGERVVQQADPDALIVRTTVVFGPEPRGRNFAYQLAGKLKNGLPVRVPADQISSPTYNRDLAAGVVRLLELGERGVFHLAGPQVIARDEFARRIARVLGWDADLVEGVATSSLAQTAARPLDAGLRIDKFLAISGELRMRDTEEAATHWLANQRDLTWP